MFHFVPVDSDNCGDIHEKKFLVQPCKRVIKYSSNLSSSSSNLSPQVVTCSRPYHKLLTNLPRSAWSSRIRGKHMPDRTDSASSAIEIGLREDPLTTHTAAAHSQMSEILTRFKSPSSTAAESLTAAVAYKVGGLQFRRPSLQLVLYPTLFQSRRFAEMENPTLFTSLSTFPPYLSTRFISATKEVFGQIKTYDNREPR